MPIVKTEHANISMPRKQWDAIVAGVEEAGPVLGRAGVLIEETNLSHSTLAVTLLPSKRTFLVDVQGRSTGLDRIPYSRSKDDV